MDLLNELTYCDRTIGTPVRHLQVGIDIGRDHETALQIDFLVCLGQMLADQFDDALLDQNFAGFIVLSADQGIGEFFMVLSFIVWWTDPGKTEGCARRGTQ